MSSDRFCCLALSCVNVFLDQKSSTSEYDFHSTLRESSIIDANNFGRKFGDDLRFVWFWLFTHLVLSFQYVHLQFSS